MVSRHSAGDDRRRSATSSTRFGLDPPPSAVPGATMVNDGPQSAVPPTGFDSRRLHYRRSRSYPCGAVSICALLGGGAGGGGRPIQRVHREVQHPFWVETVVHPHLTQNLSSPISALTWPNRSQQERSTPSATDCSSLQSAKRSSSIWCATSRRDPLRTSTLRPLPTHSNVVSWNAKTKWRSSA